MLTFISDKDRIKNLQIQFRNKLINSDLSHFQDGKYFFEEYRLWYEEVQPSPKGKGHNHFLNHFGSYEPASGERTKMLVCMNYHKDPNGPPGSPPCGFFNDDEDNSDIILHTGYYRCIRNILLNQAQFLEELRKRGTEIITLDGIGIYAIIADLSGDNTLSDILLFVNRIIEIKTDYSCFDKAFT